MAVNIVNASLVIIILAYCAQEGWLFENNEDEIALKACGPERPAILTEPGIAFGPIMNENGTYELNQTCHWLISAPTGSVVRLEFLLIEMEWTWPCAYANLTVYDNDATEQDHYLEHYCGNATAPPMHSSHEDMLVVFWAGSKGQGRGFIANYTFIQVQETACSVDGPFEMTEWSYGGFTTPRWPSSYPASTTCSWQVRSANQIRMEFIDLALEPPHDEKGCIHDNVTVYDVGDSGDNMIGVFCGNVLPDNLGATGHSLLVVFQSNEAKQYSGLRTRFELHNTTEWACSASQPAELDWGPGLITSPQTEESICYWRLHASAAKLIKLKIVTFDLPVCNLCGCAGLEVYDGDSHNAPLIGRYCGSGWEEEELLFGGDSAYLEYDSYKLAPNEGFAIEYEFFDTAEHACGSDRPLELTHPEGTITSPNYDKGDYPNDANCQWVIRAPFGYVIRLDVLEFSVEYCYGCRCDYLRVYNGDFPQDSPVMETWCGVERPLPVSTTQSDAYLTFFTDSHTTSTGFKVHYAFDYLANRACQDIAEMKYEPGTILTPGYELGEEYPGHSFCQWRVTASSTDKVIVLVVKDLDTECDSDRLTVYDGTDTNAPVIERLCGRDVSTTLRSSGGVVFLKFTSNGVVEGRGFHIEYHYNGQEDDQGIPFLPTLLISLAALLVIVLICSFCGCSTKIKRVRDRLCGRCLQSRRNRNNTNDVPLAEPRTAVLTDPSVPDYDRVMPASLQVERPPSEVDNQLYYAIANYPPPTYEEAIAQSSHSETSSQTNQSHDNLAHADSQSHISLQNLPNGRNSVSMTPGGASLHNSQSNVSIQSSDPVHNTNRHSVQYPLTRTSSSSDTSPVENSPTQGIPDIGMGILFQAGVTSSRLSRPVLQNVPLQACSPRSSVSGQHSNTVTPLPRSSSNQHRVSTPSRSSSNQSITVYSPTGQIASFSQNEIPEQLNQRDNQRQRRSSGQSCHELNTEEIDISMATVPKEGDINTVTSTGDKPTDGHDNSAFITNRAGGEHIQDHGDASSQLETQHESYSLNNYAHDSNVSVDETVV